MAERLSNKVALITGAGGGIGAEMVRRFAKEGASVVVNDVVAENAEKVVRELGSPALACVADIGSALEVDEMFRSVEETFGGLDVLVNNAFSAPNDATIVELDEADWDRTIDVCLKGPFLCAKRALPMMKRRGGGSMITISSVNALFGVGGTAYTAAKGGLISMMRLVAAEYGEWNVRSNLICPGTISTKVSMDHWEQFPKGFQNLREMYPLGRIGSPSDVADYALFLASDESAWVTGSIHVIDGGLLAGRKLEIE